MSYRPYNTIITQAVEASAAANSAALSYPLINGSGAPIDVLTPVALNASGEFKLINVAVELDALRAIGITSESVLNATEGLVVGFGRITDVTTSFVFGDVLYVSKTGTLTTTLPSIGVGGFIAGDFVIKIGKISKNQTNPVNKDLIVQVELIGQL